MKDNSEQPQFNIDQIKLIVGLGNPGKEYLRTRHNAGFMFLDSLHLEFLTENKFKAEVAQFSKSDKKLWCIKPSTYMNSSGDSVLAVCQFYKILPSEVLVVHDDLDIKLGEYKLHFNKGPKVHNGILSIESKLSTQEFWRLRIGIDNRTEELRKLISGSDYVLGRFTELEIESLDTCINKIKTDLF